MTGTGWSGGLFIEGYMREDSWIILRGRLRDCWTLVGSFIFIAVISAGCGERENFLEIEMPTDLRSIEQVSSSAESASTGIEPGKVIATLKAGETAHVVAVYHGENFDGFKVKLADDTEGLILAGDTFKVVSR
jgi:hypothetical protein